MRRSADGWTTCARGHRHWGLVGAAGLLVVHADIGSTRFLLQHRSAQVHHGSTWSIPGGALEHGETAEQGALRETREELAGLPDDLAVVATHVDDHGGWSYSTVVASSATTFEARGGWETGDEGYAWMSDDEIATIPLHPGFAASWPELRDLYADAG